MKIEIDIEDFDSLGICKECGAIFHRDYARKKSESKGPYYVYVCPSCKKIYKHYEV